MLIDNLWNWLSSNASNVIALCALGATFWQGYLSRRHNRLSVKPHIEIAIGFNFIQQEYYINMLNNGLGPALITKIQLLVDGVEVDTQTSEVFCDVISEVFHLYRYKQNYLIISGSYMMKPSEEKTFLKVEILDSLNSFPIIDSEEIHNVNSRLKVKIGYESMYGEKFKSS
ncbi:MAG: hypothetical protein CTY37_09235 [Methylotenera sp.]|nr:MAG: hypothetical protein CTY37_09235 [Methylotenera sp.]PPD14553.1 MAG: hypothetical protein CTY27_05990 [Methylotenera sp.]